MRYIEQLKKLLAIELNCYPEDFSKDENIITIAVANEGRRIYQAEPYFFHMATIGKNAVITADVQLHDFLYKWAADNQGFWLFELPNLLPLEQELNKHGYTLSQSHHMFLPEANVDPKALLKTEHINNVWYRDKDIHQFYGDERFPNAICSEYLPHRPDTLVLCGYINGELAGMAGCSEDAKGWQQIGIDVIPKYRSKGVGAYLVATLRNEIDKNGDIPFYGTSLSNLHSWNIAIKCGFRPAWVEIGCKKLTT